MSEQKTSTADPNDRSKNSLTSFSFSRNPKIIIATILVYAGVGVPFLIEGTSSLAYMLRENIPTVIGATVAGIGFLIAFSEMLSLSNSRKDYRFVDVDISRRNESLDAQLRRVKEIISKSEETLAAVNNKNDDLALHVVEKKLESESFLFDSFESYFNDIRRVLIEQAHTADQKASILLDKGTSYSKWGIAFFIIAIIVWQILSWITGFKEQYIYGIVSCSLLFVFIEFLSAWFLKQYRHFVDTSTYHIKVKSIFDRYMMSYLSIKTLCSDNDNQEAKYQAMLNILVEDIKWPESYLLKNGDISFAKEAMETMTHFAKAMRSDAKSRSKDS